jgi:glyoxylase-like metal-dependent hydrolase (beta-lactamase superfamily II)
MSSPVAPGVHRLGSSLVNYYLIEDGERLTLVDAGLPRLRADLDALLAERGKRLSDLEAVVLTHAHPDHVGFAEHAREAGVPVHVHAADAELARTRKGGGKRERSMLPYLRNRATWRTLSGFARSGIPPKVREVTTFTGGEELDVPGRPRAIHTPGHSNGHCSLVLADRGVVFTGDAMCAWNPLTGRQGPQIMPGAFNVSSETAMASLRALEKIDAGTVLFGHGEPWTDGLASCVARAREAGPS